MPCLGIGFRVDGDSADTHAAGGLDDAAGDFAAVGNQKFVEHLEPFTTKAPRHQETQRNPNEQFFAFLGAPLVPWCLGG